MGKRAVVPEAQKVLYDRFHFAPAIDDGEYLFVSGCIGTGSDGQLPNDPKSQFANAFENVVTVLQEEGMGFDDVVDMTTFRVDLQKHMSDFMEVKDGYVDEPYPAWTAIGITELAVPGALVEIKVVARKR